MVRETIDAMLGAQGGVKAMAAVAWEALNELDDALSRARRERKDACP